MKKIIVFVITITTLNAGFFFNESKTVKGSLNIEEYCYKGLAFIRVVGYDSTPPVQVMEYDEKLKLVIPKKCKG